MIYPDKEQLISLKLKDYAKALAIAEAHKVRHSERGPCKGWVNGVAMPHSAEVGEQGR